MTSGVRRTLTLTSVPWASLTTAYGPATRVPELLAVLRSADGAARRAARDELCSQLQHQESVYDATAAAVPFLVELALEPSVADRHLLLTGLVGVALGDPSAFVVAGGLARELPEFQAPLPRTRVLELLAALGPSALPALRASLARAHRHADVVAIALAALGEPTETTPAGSATAPGPTKRASVRKEKA